MRTLPLLLLLALLITGCWKSPDAAAPVPEGTPVQWQQLALPGRTMVLVHPTHVQIFRFQKDFVTATFGYDGPTGPVAGPVLFWGIRDGGLIISKSPVSAPKEHGNSSDPDAEVFETLSNPVLNRDTLSATRKSGERVVYRLASS